MDEYLQRDVIPSPKTPYPPRLIPIVTQVTSDQVLVRVHRRVGEERTLTATELREWANRVEAMLRAGAGVLKRIWFIWNTNYEMQAFVNAEKLTALLPAGVTMDWKAHYVQSQKSNKGSMFAFLAKSPAKKAAPAPPAAVAPAKRAEDDDDDNDGRDSVTPSMSEDDEVDRPTPAKKQKAAPGSISNFFSPTKK